MESNNLGLASCLFPWLGRLYTSNLSKASSWPHVLFGVHEGVHVTVEVTVPQVAYISLTALKITEGVVAKILYLSVLT